MESSWRGSSYPYRLSHERHASTSCDSAIAGGITHGLTSLAGHDCVGQISGSGGVDRQEDDEGASRSANANAHIVSSQFLYVHFLRLGFPSTRVRARWMRTSRHIVNGLPVSSNPHRLHQYQRRTKKIVTCFRPCSSIKHRLSILHAPQTLALQARQFFTTVSVPAAILPE
ncbi:hypothetical protein FA95DRAFT_1269618 [Auriscalpium vulgare]|uniref:Uncharacterized protein n=1 Tax=Auriscalpium vulgare TaxID=40419 RepID=A0ACB8R2M7_9AGAM|nr:hypothetical protein FA95DRAFT_1269618 [Auriscalpium vulgare]